MRKTQRILVPQIPMIDISVGAIEDPIPRSTPVITSVPAHRQYVEQITRSRRIP